MPINGRKIWGGSNIGDNWDLYTKALIPGNFGSMPHGEKDTLMISGTSYFLLL